MLSVHCAKARGDAPESLSKSCSDKLALKSVTSLLSALASFLVAPDSAYLHTLVIAESQYVPEACDRAFGSAGRMVGVGHVQETAWASGYGWRPFAVTTTGTDFPWSRKGAAEGEEAVPTVPAIIWTPDLSEVLVNGVLQGRKLFDHRGASGLSRRMMWLRLMRLCSLSGLTDQTTLLDQNTYRDVKEQAALSGRRNLKKIVEEVALTNWIPNSSDHAFALH